MKSSFKKLTCAAVFGIAAAIAGTASASALDKIKEAGVLRVGVKADYRPFGFLNADGKVVGVEPDLARDVADRLSVGLELVQVQTANRMEFLQQGRIDLMIATMSVNEQRRRAVGVIEPYYYGGGTALLIKKDSPVTQWSDVKGRKICGTQGAYYNRNVAQKYGAEIVAFPGSTEAQTALLTGSCEGFLQDSTLIAAMLSDPSGQWADYRMPLPVEDLQMWSVAVASGELNGPWGDFMKDVVIDWHRTGLLLKKEQEWDLPESAFLVEMHEQYKAAR